ncbi:hypothetical protein PHYBLDRAFT_72990 [Phycomyces blakesleeanus NRRL 1555(-)]|uniref:Uncharacterized protein n=1 Tax=Phycomyces blakesleeanus (strain ATCC 8743b / DSM 1359 / FGSC 10004 / NBRC 33097 / NRRL 1555) TaxID=763407 RepID=A0A162N3X9_PHYB8|nr:hypothetical protein PHYBLDRAFT_72990 [Phycomyces blakesleeanus NRRL 1555(-)]OAD68278.1 hypothetical protein PHYBLDRAFT_72990 [Phycomyces blakesleeanus NRRL 1555(-)]|eukprot:XP_018286318.1 hypothetical protein PHYBLDRAFT_72990 [Phycomyces blakesleeanus NRRL 1555(-)]
MSTFNSVNDYENRIVPDYIDSIDFLTLLSEDEFTNWLNKIAKKHANWIYHQLYNHNKNSAFIELALKEPLKVKTVVCLCDHAEKPKKKLSSLQQVQKRVRTTKSIKIGCPANIYKHVMTDGTIHIKYNWQYLDHDPFQIEEISSSRLPDKLKQWVEELVGQNMDWKSIKNMLRMSEDRLFEVNILYFQEDMSITKKVSNFGWKNSVRMETQLCSQFIKMDLLFFHGFQIGK